MTSKNAIGCESNSDRVREVASDVISGQPNGEICKLELMWIRKSMPGVLGDSEWTWTWK